MTKSVSQLTDPVRSEDADEIYEIIQEAFGKKLLAFTVFHSPLAKGYLQKLLQGKTDSRHWIGVIRKDRRIDGFYDAVKNDSVFFLNYIAVRRGCRGEGFGKDLLEHFEEMAANSGCKQIGLEVFEENTAARRWYTTHKYHIDRVSYQARVNMELFDASLAAVPLGIDTETYLDACWKEKNEMGFSKFDCSLGSARVTVGIIGCDTCKLMNFTGTDLDAAVASLIAHFRGRGRKILIVTGLPLLPRDWPLLSVEKVLHLSKTINY